MSSKQILTSSSSSSSSSTSSSSSSSPKSSSSSSSLTTSSSSLHTSKHHPYQAEIKRKIEPTNKKRESSSRDVNTGTGNEFSKKPVDDEDDDDEEKEKLTAFASAAGSHMSYYDEYDEDDDDDDTSIDEDPPKLEKISIPRTEQPATTPSVSATVISNAGGRCRRRFERCRVVDVNPYLLCALCSGYLIDATTIIECLHTFCRSCILRYLESSETCPVCDVPLHQTNPLMGIKSDKTLQTLVYKLVPGVYKDEIRRRCLLANKIHAENKDVAALEAILKDINELTSARTIYNGDEAFSVSLQYCRVTQERQSVDPGDKDKSDLQSTENTSPVEKVSYLNCPSSATVTHVAKLLHNKLELDYIDYEIEIYYGMDKLDGSLKLLDVAYITTWNNTSPMTLNYKILVNTARMKTPDAPLDSATTTLTTTTSAVDVAISGREATVNSAKSTTTSRAALKMTSSLKSSSSSSSTLITQVSQQAPVLTLSSSTNPCTGSRKPSCDEQKTKVDFNSKLQKKQDAPITRVTRHCGKGINESESRTKSGKSPRRSKNETVVEKSKNADVQTNLSADDEMILTESFQTEFPRGNNNNNNNSTINNNNKKLENETVPSVTSSHVTTLIIADVEIGQVESSTVSPKSRDLEVASNQKERQKGEKGEVVCPQHVISSASDNVVSSSTSSQVSEDGEETPSSHKTSVETQTQDFPDTEVKPSLTFCPAKSQQDQDVLKKTRKFFTTRSRCENLRSNDTSSNPGSSLVLNSSISIASSLASSVLTSSLITSSDKPGLRILLKQKKKKEKHEGHVEICSIDSNAPKIKFKLGKNGSDYAGIGTSKTCLETSPIVGLFKTPETKSVINSPTISSQQLIKATTNSLLSVALTTKASKAAQTTPSQLLLTSVSPSSRAPNLERNILTTTLARKPPTEQTLSLAAISRSSIGCTAVKATSARDSTSTTSTTVTSEVNASAATFGLVTSISKRSCDERYKEFTHEVLEAKRRRLLEVETEQPTDTIATKMMTTTTTTAMTMPVPMKSTTTTTTAIPVVMKTTTRQVDKLKSHKNKVDYNSNKFSVKNLNIRGRSVTTVTTPQLGYSADPNSLRINTFCPRGVNEVIRVPVFTPANSRKCYSCSQPLQTTNASAAITARGRPGTSTPRNLCGICCQLVARVPAQNNCSSGFQSFCKNQPLATNSHVAQIGTTTANGFLSSAAAITSIDNKMHYSFVDHFGGFKRSFETPAYSTCYSKTIPVVIPQKRPCSSVTTVAAPLQLLSTSNDSSCSDDLVIDVEKLDPYESSGTTSENINTVLHQHKLENTIFPPITSLSQISTNSTSGCNLPTTSPTGAKRLKLTCHGVTTYRSLESDVLAQAFDLPSKPFVSKQEERVTTTPAFVGDRLSTNYKSIEIANCVSVETKLLKYATVTTLASTVATTSTTSTTSTTPTTPTTSTPSAADEVLQLNSSVQNLTPPPKRHQNTKMENLHLHLARIAKGKTLQVQSTGPGEFEQDLTFQSTTTIDSSTTNFSLDTNSTNVTDFNFNQTPAHLGFKLSSLGSIQVGANSKLIPPLEKDDIPMELTISKKEQPTVDGSLRATSTAPATSNADEAHAVANVETCEGPLELTTEMVRERQKHLQKLSTSSPSLP